MSHSQSDSYNQRIQSPNFTQIPNVVLDYWMNHLDSSSFKVLIFICRKTIGWHKNKDCLSLKKICEGTFLAKTTVSNSIKTLESHGLIIKQMHKNSLGDQDPNTYELIIHEGVVQNLDNVVQNLDYGGSPEIGQGVVQNLDTQKKDLQKKTYKEKEKIEKEKEKFGFCVELTKQEYDKLCAEYTKSKIDQIIDDINLWCEAHGESYTGYAAAIRKWIKKEGDFKPQGSKSNQVAVGDNKNLAEKFFQMFYCSQAKIEVLSKHVEIIPSGNHQPVCINYSELGFKEQLENALRKFGFKKKKE